MLPDKEVALLSLGEQVHITASDSLILRCIEIYDVLLFMHALTVASDVTYQKKIDISKNFIYI